MKVRIYWGRKCDPETKEKIRDKFNLPRYTTIKGETDGEIKSEDYPTLEECARRGFIQIRKKWE